VAPARVDTPLVALSEGASTSSGITRSGSGRSAAVLVDRIGRKRSGSRKHAPFDEAAGGGDPGSSSVRSRSVGVKSHKPDRGSATESVRGQGHGLPPGRKRREEGAPRGGLAITSPQVRASLAPGRPGTIVHPRRSHGLAVKRGPRSIMLSAKVSTGRAAWKLPSPAKAAGGGDSRTRRSVECSCLKSVAEVG